MLYISEIVRVGRQIFQYITSFFKGLLDIFAFMEGGIIHMGLLQDADN
jgi:hypothetical protein